jgi:hypothetical protein
MGASGKAPSFTPTSYSALDPASQGRRDHLYNQAQEYAATNPYSQRYGGNVTGMTPMGMAGQQFMTNRMMGPGAYQAQNLGFQNYQPSFTYSPMGGGGGGQPPFTPPVQPPAIDPMATTAPTVAPPTVGDATVGSPGGVGTDQANVVGAVADASIPTATTFGPPPTNQAEVDARAAAMEAEGRRQRGVDTAANANVPGFQQQGTPQFQPRGLATSASPNDLMRRTIEYDTPDRGPAQLQPQGGGSDEFGPGGRYEGTGGPGLSAPNIDMAAVGPPAIGMQQQPTGGQPDLGFGGPQMDTMTPPGGQPPVPPADGEEFTPASIGGIETVLAQKDPTVTAASALGRPEGEGVSAYMDATGVDAQIASAQQDYEEQLAALQAQQAGSGAFGSRGDLQDMGAMGEHLRNIGNIRAAGFDKAATRMDADLAREQQAALEQARLQQNLTGQQLTAAQALGREERAIGQEFRDMGADQRRIMEQQRIFDEEQWRRTMEGPGRELAMVRGFLPPDIRQQMVRDPSGTQKALSLAGGVGSLLGGPVGGLLGKGLGKLFGGDDEEELEI